jgi:hypothetical protein
MRKPNTKQQKQQKEFYDWRNGKYPLAFAYKVIFRHGKKYISFPKEVFIPLDYLEDLIKEIKKGKSLSQKEMQLGIALSIPFHTLNQTKRGEKEK